MNELANKIMCNTLNKVSEVMYDAADVFNYVLEEKCASITEIALANEFIELYTDIVNNLIMDEFDVVPSEIEDEDEDIECDGDCENCSYSEDEDDDYLYI